MARLLKRSGVKGIELGYIYILVVGSNDFCDKLKKALHNHSEKKDLKMKVHTSNNIQNILDAVLPEVDFIVFAINSQYLMCLQELENNIKLLEDFLKFGHMCFVNNDTIKPGEMAVSCNDILEIKNKYDVHLFNGNVESERKCLYLAERILNLVSVTLGVKTGIPYIDCPRPLE